MSEERSEIVDGGGGEPSGRDYKKKKMEDGCEEKVKKGKRVGLFGLGKVKQRLQRRNKRASNWASSDSTTGCSGKRVGCYLCFKQPQTMDSSAGSGSGSGSGSQTSDPNHPDFSLELLKGLIEKNDFYSVECNTHFDSDS